MNNATLINQTSGCVEYYTPKEIIEAARRFLGVIDLDPASCGIANQTVQATQFFTEEQDGLTAEWHGRIWMNHPFGRRTNKLWIEKLMDEFRAGHVREALCITFACTSEAWFKPLLIRPQCYLTPRTNYIGPDGKPVRGVTKGSVITLFGQHTRQPAFRSAFQHLGVVKV